MSQTHFLVYADSKTLFEEAARFFVDTARQAIAARGRFTVSLSGGSTPRALYELLAQPHWRLQFDWNRVVLFWGDERFVPSDDPQSNYHMVHEALLRHIDIPEANVFRVPTEMGEPDTVAAAYQQMLREDFALSMGVPQFDLVLLGLGENGHTASLFPHRPVLHEQHKLVAADYVEEVGMYRITMTVPVINKGRKVVFLLSGSSKAQVLHDVVAGPYQPEQLPAQLVNPVQGQLYYLLDHGAASKLPAELWQADSSKAS